MMIIIETDHNAYTEDTKQQRKVQMAEEMREAAGEDEQVLLLPVLLFYPDDEVLSVEIQHTFVIYRYRYGFRPFI
jgi:hypothetical protein